MNLARSRRYLAVFKRNVNKLLWSEPGVLTPAKNKKRMQLAAR